MNIIIEKEQTFQDEFLQALDTHQQLVGWEEFKLHYQAQKQNTIEDFQALMAPNHLTHVTFLKHQVKTAQTVIGEMNGRAILADEVGLGKTIEAGLILKEYMMRKMVHRVLLLVPASLTEQWARELNDKFHIRAAIYKKNYDWADYPVFITTLDLAKRQQHQEALLQLNFDMVIIDEAHKLKNHRTKNYALVRALKKKYCLLLTATPIENKVIEIFNLITILKPGYLGSYDDFLTRYQHQTNLKEESYLRKLIKKVMVRNVRKDTIHEDVQRNVETIWLEFTNEEKQVYNQIEQDAANLSPLARLTYLRELCSSREACFLSLEQTDDEASVPWKEDIRAEIAKLPHHVKANRLVELIQSLNGEKVIVFTEYRATQYYLAWYLQQHDISSVSYRGGMKSGRKTWLTQLFQANHQVFLATEAGGEGINLQFCHYMINYDLPWNPMRLEQRIGRIHRYGQKNNLHIFHFAIRDTIESHMMQLLYKKVGLFEQVIGKLDAILADEGKLSDNDWLKVIENSYSKKQIEPKAAPSKGQNNMDVTKHAK